MCRKRTDAPIHGNYQRVAVVLKTWHRTPRNNRPNGDDDENNPQDPFFCNVWSALRWRIRPE